jgi:GTPase SAR1 family protein
MGFVGRLYGCCSPTADILVLKIDSSFNLKVTIKMKTPKQLRADIQTLTQHLGQIRDALNQRSNEQVAQIGKECKRTADVLTTLLNSQVLPENYKVAVVGRFKAGKSSFVNELLGAQLAGEDTSPETAAITKFRHGNSVKASISFVPKETWIGLQTLYEDDSTHVDAHRVRVWKSFSKPKKTNSGELSEFFDLQQLETEFIKSGGRSVDILLADETKKSVNDFRAKLKKFTSGSRPHHCLVESIEITSNAKILDEGILLIDTPGLDDTERFRVSLTEKAVEDVDAVLFLTKSGVAYGQSEKDFLLTLLRKGTVKPCLSGWLPIKLLDAPIFRCRAFHT